MDLEETIVAIATPLGEGGIGIVRLSGSRSVEIADTILELPAGKRPGEVGDRSMTLCHCRNGKTGEKLDQVLVCIMRGPNTYTREDVVEINCHGGVVALQETLEAAVEAGARLAGPGEFTKRAFLNGRIDLAQAEAVVDVIRAKTRECLQVATAQLDGRLSKQVAEIRAGIVQILVQLEAAIDFSDEDIECMNRAELTSKIEEAMGNVERLVKTARTGKIYREGVDVVIAGRPNVGKSSLLNALLRQTRVIVTSIPGTTRDIVEEIVNIGGVPFKLRDTAGIRNPCDEIEEMGVELSRGAIRSTSLVLLVFDGSEALREEDFLVMEEVQEEKTIAVINKADLALQIEESDIGRKFAGRVRKVSAKEEKGLDELRQAMLDAVVAGRVGRGAETIVTNVRHKKALERAQRDLREGHEGAVEGVPEECIAAVLKDVLDSLGEITGETAQENVLDEIFSRFCIGK